MAGSLAEGDVPRITVRNSKKSGKQNALAFSSHVINMGDVLISRGGETPSAVPEAISTSFCRSSRFSVSPGSSPEKYCTFSLIIRFS